MECPRGTRRRTAKRVRDQIGALGAGFALSEPRENHNLQDTQVARAGLTDTAKPSLEGPSAGGSPV